MTYVVISASRTIIALALVALVTLVGEASAEDRTIGVEKDDPAMVAAIAKARASLPYFWEHLAKPRDGESEFALKLGLTDGMSTEHFWCNSIKGTAMDATCLIDNDPVSVQTVKLGQRVQVNEPTISDWMFLRNDKIVGGETIRALLPKLSQQEADGLRSLLETP